MFTTSSSLSEEQINRLKNHWRNYEEEEEEEKPEEAEDNSDEIITDTLRCADITPTSLGCRNSEKLSSEPCNKNTNTFLLFCFVFLRNLL